MPLPIETVHSILQECCTGRLAEAERRITALYARQQIKSALERHYGLTDTLDLTPQPQPAVRDPSKLPASELTNPELIAEHASRCAEWDAFFTPDFEGHGGSPGEWLAERIGELDQEVARRGGTIGPQPECAVSFKG